MGRLSQAPPLAGLLPTHGTFQGHATHLVERSTTLSPNDSWGACTPTWDYLLCFQSPSSIPRSRFMAHSSAWLGPYAADAAVQREGTATAPQYPYLFIGQFLGGMGYMIQLNTCLANSSHPTALRAIGRT